MALYSFKIQYQLSYYDDMKYDMIHDIIYHIIYDVIYDVIYIVYYIISLLKQSHNHQINSLKTNERKKFGSNIKYLKCIPSLELLLRLLEEGRLLPPVPTPVPSLSLDHLPLLEV